MTIVSRLRSRFAAAMPELRNVTASPQVHENTHSASNRFRALLVDSQGSSSFETIVVTFFLMLPVLLGTFSVAMALVAYQQMGYATMTATQTLADGRGILTDPCKTAANSITASLPQWNSANFGLTVTITSTVNGSNTTTSYGPYAGASAATCTAAATTLSNATGGANGNPVTLHMTYTYNWFPIFGKGITGTLATEFTMLVQ